MIISCRCESHTEEDRHVYTPTEQDINSYSVQKSLRTNLGNFKLNVVLEKIPSLLLLLSLCVES